MLPIRLDRPNSFLVYHPCPYTVCLSRASFGQIFHICFPSKNIERTPVCHPSADLHLETKTKGGLLSFLLLQIQPSPNRAQDLSTGLPSVHLGQIPILRSKHHIPQPVLHVCSSRTARRVRKLENPHASATIIYWTNNGRKHLQQTTPRPVLQFNIKTNKTALVEERRGGQTNFITKSSQLSSMKPDTRQLNN